MIPTLVIGVDPDKDTPAFASVLIGADYSIKVVGVGIAGAPKSIHPTLTHNLGSSLVPMTHTRVFVESPEAIYTKGRGIRVQDIVELARRAGEMATALYYSGFHNIDYISPAEWKGQVPKGISQARICKRLNWTYEIKGTQKSGQWCQVTGFGSATVPQGMWALNHKDWKHVLDAMGIALWGADTIIDIDRRAAAVARNQASQAH